MKKLSLIFKPEQPTKHLLSWGDVVVLASVAVLIYLGVQLALRTPSVIEGPAISLAPTALPRYAALSVGRLAAAYILSLFFTFVYGSMAARSQRAEQILLPLLDVLQSVPILSFLPVVLLSLSAVLPAAAAAEPPSCARAERQLDIIVNWGRYAELLAYDDSTQTISLDPTGITALVQSELAKSVQK
jgi:NitT/TauT family transport system permease protein